MSYVVALLIWMVGCLAAQAASSPNTHANITSYLAAKPQNEFQLPRGLDEISGLAVASESSVFAHDDEYGIVYEIDIATGKVTRAFALGKPTVHQDFEDIAATRDRIYLLTSNGLIFEALKGEHRKRVLFNVYDTGIGKTCETEGLIRWQDDSTFLVLCKTTHDDSLTNHLVIFRWSLKDRLPATQWLSVSLDGILKRSKQQNFHPSAFVWRPETQTFVVISAKDRTVIEIDRAGRLISHCKVAKSRHPQAEGMTEMPDGRLVISDEGKGGHGKIDIYAVPR